MARKSRSSKRSMSSKKFRYFDDTRYQKVKTYDTDENRQAIRDGVHFKDRGVPARIVKTKKAITLYRKADFQGGRRPSGRKR